MKTKNPNALNKTADSAMSHGKPATLVDSCCGGGAPFLDRLN